MPLAFVGMNLATNASIPPALVPCAALSTGMSVKLVPPVRRTLGLVELVSTAMPPPTVTPLAGALPPR